MGTATYFLFLFGVFIAGMVVMTAYYLFSERREFMEISDQPFRCRLNKAGAIQSLFLILACVLFCFLCPDKEWIKNNQMYFVCALFAGFGLIGLVPLKNKACHVGVAFLQIAGIAAALLLLPENSFFFNFDIPKWLDKVCAGALWFAVLRLLMRMDKLDSFTAVQGTSVGLACAAALFVTIPLSAVFFQFSGILFAVSAVLCIFFALGSEIPSSPVFKNVFAFAVSWAAFYMASQGRWGNGALLLAYPLAEAVIFACRSIKGALLKEKPLFLFESLQNRNFPDWYIIRYVFRRNLLLDGLFLLSLMAQKQYQPVILAGLFMLDYYLRAVSPKRDDSIKSLFKNMTKDAKKSFKETNKAFSDLKEMYKNKSENKQGKSDDK